MNLGDLASLDACPRWRRYLLNRYIARHDPSERYTARVAKAAGVEPHRVEHAADKYVVDYATLLRCRRGARERALMWAERKGII